MKNRHVARCHGLADKRRFAMIGWWIYVTTQSSGKEHAATLAQWEVGWDGLAWIEQLVEAGKATILSKGGYPNSYTARAGDVLPFIKSASVKPPVVFGIDDHLSWMGKMEINADRMAACPDDSLLLIIAYDLS
jgi:hypothetical protein